MDSFEIDIFLPFHSTSFPCHPPWNIPGPTWLHRSYAIYIIKEGQDDEALEDFRDAAALGSAFAKSMLVELNPYAAMCNAMLK